LNRRVVVTGIGLVSPVGNTVEEAWSSVVEGRSGVGPVTRFDSAAFPSKVAGEVRNFQAEDWMSPRDARLSDPFLHYAVAAAKMALDDSRLLEQKGINERTGTCIGTASGGLNVLVHQQGNLDRKGPRFVSPMTVPFTICDMAPGYVSIQHDLRGPNHSLVSACASGASAIGEAYWMIQRRSVDAMVAGAADAIVPLHMAAFASASALSTHNENPAGASRPFDSARNGFVMSEGAAILVLEDREMALARGARIYGELVGYGSCADAHHITAPESTGRGARRAMLECLEMAGITPKDIGYVNAHATSTPVGDRIESAAIREVFGDLTDSLPVSSTKSTTGHLIGAAGSIEAIFCLLAMRDGILPPTINLENQDPDCRIDAIPNVARKAHVDHCLSNSFGFGGHNVSLLFRRHE
jgi:3-oxoacyl-[acyl-carrier-protein] synthase II